MSATSPALSTSAATEAAPLLVACLCAAWCRTCDSYRDTLAAVRDALRMAHPDAVVRFVWVDIEDESALVGDLDVEDFPTILLGHGDRVLFFGPVMPHAQTLDRLVRGALAEPAALAPPSAWPADVLALPGRLGTHAAI